MDSADRNSQVEAYFAALTASDIPGILALFETDAWVMSPFLGRMNATDFFAKLDAASAGNKLTVFNILLAPDLGSAAAHFQYDWTLATGDQLTFQGVDLFSFGPGKGFASMQIFYDTHPLRAQVGNKYA